MVKFIDNRSKIRGNQLLFFVKKFLIPLLAVFALPTAINAESYWLVLYVGQSTRAGRDLEKIEMPDLLQCQEQGEIFIKKEFAYKNDYICLKGK